MLKNPSSPSSARSGPSQNKASFSTFCGSLVTRLVFWVSIILVISIMTWAFFTISYQKQKVMKEVMRSTQRLSKTILLGANYAMMLNSREDINQIIRNIGKLQEVRSVRIYSKDGRIRFSNNPNEVDRITAIRTEACILCHQTDPPRSHLPADEGVRFFESPEGEKSMGLITPIYNEASCSAHACHIHPEGKKILGALDVVVSFQNAHAEIFMVKAGITSLAVILFLFTSSFIFYFVFRFVKRPIKNLIRATRRISTGDYAASVAVDQSDEIGELANAMNRMIGEIEKKQVELNDQRNRFQNLFEGVPCIITVQDRNYRLVGYNKEFSRRFDPKPGDFCYRAYKGRNSKCLICPVEKTFQDGKTHSSEEVGINKDGTKTYWVVRTAPIRNEKGEIIAAMEMNLDITAQKNLEEQLAVSERKYHAIFDNIPNPVFVVDMESLKILDCNESVTPVYGFEKKELVDTSFLDLFLPQERDAYAVRIRSAETLTRVRNQGKTGKRLFVNFRIALSEYEERQVFLITASDITRRLEAEQQLIHASKMATLGEMSTGSFFLIFFMKKLLAVLMTASG